MYDDKIVMQPDGTKMVIMSIDLWVDEDEDIFLMFELESGQDLWHGHLPERPGDFDCGFLWFSDGVKMIHGTNMSQWIFGLN